MITVTEMMPVNDNKPVEPYQFDWIGFCWVVAYSAAACTAGASLVAYIVLKILGY